MKRALVLCLVMLALGLPSPRTRAAGEPASSCVTCHGELPDRMGAPLDAWAGDVHNEVGLGCVGCHGGDPAPALAEDLDAMAPGTGFNPAPDRLQTADFCARCHADATFMKRFNPDIRVDQLMEYRTSGHGRLNAAGDPIPATCSDCHGSHGIHRIDSPDSPAYATNVPATCARCHADPAIMAPYNRPVDIFDRYRGSVHGVALLDRGDLAAPACNDCHGNHGAVPPGVTSVANVCGQCHGRESMLFNASFKKEMFDAMGVSECVVCHSQHRILHPTPDLYDSRSAPEVSRGSITGTDPFRADLGLLAAGQTASATWRSVLRPGVKPDAEELRHTILIDVAGGENIELDATVRPGQADRDPELVRTGRAGNLTVRLTMRPLAGGPVEAGDTIIQTLDLTAHDGPAAGAITIIDRPGSLVDPIQGSVCLTCHSVGDDCDIATAKMFTGLILLQEDLRTATNSLRRAEHAGMEISQALFELRSEGVSAAIEAQALLHTFDPPQVLERTSQGQEIARQGLDSAAAAMEEIQVRRKGLAVSLVLVLLVLVALSLKIRQINRIRDLESSTNA